MTAKKAIYSSSKGMIYQEDVENALKEAGLEKGDTVMVHSDLQVFGKLADIKSKQEFLGSILAAFLNVLGKEGTLIVPVFTYSFCRKEIFDVQKTPSSVGSFSEFVRKQKNAVRSIHPIFSLAGKGKNAKKLLTNLSKNSFGENSFFDKLYKMNGKIMLFGRPFDITYIHYIEHAHGVKYRFIKKFSGIIIDSEGDRSEETYDYFVRYLDKGVEYKMENLGNEMDKKGLLKKAELGNSSILLLNTQDAFKVGWEMLDKNEYAFLAKKPSI